MFYKTFPFYTDEYMPAKVRLEMISYYIYRHVIKKLKGKTDMSSIHTLIPNKRLFKQEIYKILNAILRLDIFFCILISAKATTAEDVFQDKFHA